MPTTTTTGGGGRPSVPGTPRRAWGSVYTVPG
jgi:hypothetical protein